MRGSRNFCQLYLVLILLQFTEGSNGFIAVKTLLILYQGSRGGSLFSRQGGPYANFLRNPYAYLLFSRGVSGPPIPLWIRTWAMSS